jgi:hypothetical protein
MPPSHEPFALEHSPGGVLHEPPQAWHEPFPSQVPPGQNEPLAALAYTQAPPTQEPGSFWQSGGVVHGPPQGRHSPFWLHCPPSQGVPASSQVNVHIVPAHVPGVTTQSVGATAQPPGQPLVLELDVELELGLVPVVAALAVAPAPPAPPVSPGRSWIPMIVAHAAPNVATRATTSHCDRRLIGALPPRRSRPGPATPRGRPSSRHGHVAR